MKIYEARDELKEWLADLAEPVSEAVLEKMDELEMKHE